MSKRSQYVQTLHDLHSEIKSTTFDNPEHAEKMETISVNIQEIVEHPGEVPFEIHNRLMTNLRENVIHFETTHPTITGLMNTVIRTLNNLGI